MHVCSVLNWKLLVQEPNYTNHVLVMPATCRMMNTLMHIFPCGHINKCNQTQQNLYPVWYLFCHSQASVAHCSYDRSQVRNDFYPFLVCLQRKPSNGNDTIIKASHMEHFVMVSLWCASLSTNTRFCFFYYRINDC